MPKDLQGFTPMTKDEARAFVSSSTWKFAKTMPTIPHEYVVWNTVEVEADFVRFIYAIRKHGKPKTWGRYTRLYLELDGWNYWTMDAEIVDTKIINRQRVEDFTVGMPK